MKDCVFCDRIRRGDVDDDKWGPGVVSFEPLNPVTPGHRLFVPTSHRTDAAADSHTAGRVFDAASLFAQYEMEDFNLITSAGSAATQTIRHLHVHYVPRRPNDGLALPWSATPTTNDDKDGQTDGL